MMENNNKNKVLMKNKEENSILINFSMEPTLIRKSAILEELLVFIF